MPRQGQVVIRTAKGRYSQFNRLATPPGALLVADNAVIDRPGIIEKRRGFRRYGDTLAHPASAIFKYQKRLIVLDGTALKRDSDGAGTWIIYDGSVSPPDTSTRVEAVEAQQSFYYTTSLGPQKIDKLDGTPRRAGIPGGLDIQTMRTGTGGSWFLVDSQVGYRVLWGKIDANTQEAVGEPTGREVLANAKSSTVSWARSGGGPYTVTVTHTAHGYATSDVVEISDSTAVGLNGPQTITATGADTYTFTVTPDPGASGTLKDGKKFNVQVTTTIPTGMAAGDFYEVYRTALSAAATADPGDRELKVRRVDLTAADITAGIVTFLDTGVPDPTQLGEDLYTNPLRETISRANARPPWAKHLAVYKGHVFYANTLQPQKKEIQLLDVQGLTDDLDTITIATRTYTFSGAEDFNARKFKRFTAELTGAENVRKTAQSLVRAINRDLGNASVSARYVSGPTEDPGKIRIFARDLNTSPFSITSSTAAGPKFSPTLPATGTAVSSAADRKKNGLYRSKHEKPEAVPEANFDLIGSAAAEITGIRALKDALLIYTEAGLWSLTGETDGASGSSFVIDQLDPTLILIAGASLASLENAVYAYTSQGVVRSSESGSKIMSWPIEFELNQIAQFLGFSTLAHSVNYESDRKLLFFTQDKASDTKSKVGHCWNYLTEAWTRWKKPVSAGVVLELEGGGDRLYLAHAVDPYILEERKSFVASDEDYMDETLDVTITAVGTAPAIDGSGLTVTTATLTYTYAGENLTSGFLLEQGVKEGVIVDVQTLGTSSFLCTLDRSVTLAPGAATVSIPIRLEVQWMPDAAGNAGTTKQFSEVQIYFDRDGGTHQLGFCSDTQSAPDFTREITIPRSRGWGASKWGNSAWGDAQPSASNPLQAIVPRGHQWARTLRVIYLNARAKENVQILQMTISVGEQSERTMRAPR